MGKNVRETAQEIIKQIHNYIHERGGNYKEWYVGIAKEAHNGTLDAVKMYSHCWIYIETGSSQIAIEVLNYFVNILGTNGGRSTLNSTDHGSVVYAYKKKPIHLLENFD